MIILHHAVSCGKQKHLKNKHMKILKFQFIVLILFLSTTIFAQSLDCPSNLKMRHPSPPFGFNDLSKSAQCLTGKKYEFLLPLTKGKDYRISFFASPVFNNNIQFRIIDVNSGKKVFDLPGESEANNKGECVLKAYFDNKLNKLVHPYFDFFPHL
ncbi:MAG: hypothetical protein B6I20_02405 [Bacteroidetes bacterium 4572_117]|nr:MAG: hypothetical protein B6I20_02405 [Bacteroidetes bacterium 4572_117]